jgi:hypothetical protein
MITSPHVFFVALAIGSIASAVDVTPVEKVITMLEDLMTQTIVEGKAEAKTYDKFACFCKDSTEDKTFSISEGMDRVASLEADIADRIAYRNKQQQNILESQKALEANTEKEKAGRKKRKDQDAIFQEEKADINVLKKEIQAAKDALLEGIAEPEEGASPAFLEVFARVKAARQAIKQPDAITKNLTPQEQIVKAALEPLQEDADDAWKKIHAREVQEKADLTLLLQEVKFVKDQEELKISKAQAKSSVASDDIGRMGQELTLAQAALTDDRNYLTELTAS